MARRKKNESGSVITNQPVTVKSGSGSLKRSSIKTEEPKKENPNIYKPKEDPTANIKGGSHGFSGPKQETPPKAFDDIVSTSPGKKDPTKKKPMQLRRADEVAAENKKADYENDKQLTDKWFREMYDLEGHDISGWTGHTGDTLQLGKFLNTDKDKWEHNLRAAAIETGRTRKEVEDMYNTYKLRRGAENIVNNASDYANNEGVNGKAIASLASLGANFASGLGAIPALVKNASGDVDADSTDSFGHVMGDVADKTRAEVANTMKTNAGRQIYNIGMGLGDMGVNATAAGLAGPASVFVLPALQGLDAAEDFSRLALENGASGRGAAAAGLTAGALDFLFNKFGLDTIMGQGVSQTGKQVLKNAAMGALAEGGNNALQQALSLGADYGINRENSQLGNVYQDALNNGMTDTQARSEALKYLLGSSAKSGAVGAAFGGALAGARGLGSLSQYNANEARLKAIQDNEVRLLEAQMDAEAKAKAKADQEAADYRDMLNQQWEELGNTYEPETSNRVPAIRPNSIPEDLSYTELMDEINSPKYYLDDAKRLARKLRDLDNSLNTMTDLSDIQNYADTRTDLVNQLNQLGYDFDSQGRLWDMEEVESARRAAEIRDQANALVERFNKTKSERTRNSIRRQLEKLGYGLVDEGNGYRAENLNDMLSESEPSEVPNLKKNNSLIAENTNGNPQPIDYDEVRPTVQEQPRTSPREAQPIDYDEEPIRRMSEPVYEDNVAYNDELGGGDISQHYETLLNSDLIQKSQANIESLNKALEAGVFDKTVEGRLQAQEEALDEYLADKAGAMKRNFTKAWNSGKDLDMSMLILKDALEEGDQANINLTLLKQTRQLKSAGRELRANRDYAGTVEGTYSKAMQFLDDRADEVLNSGKKVRERIESQAERILNDNELIEKMDIDDAAKDMLWDAVEIGASKEDITRMLAMYEKVGKMGISEDTYKQLRKIYDQMEGLGLTSKARAELEDEAYRVIAQDIGGARTLRDKWDAWRYLAMLGNPKTHIRNILGNTTHYMVTEAKDNLAALIESAVGAEERTKAVLSLADRSLVDASANDADNVYTLLNDSGNKYNVKTEIDKARDAFDSKGVNAYYKSNNWLLDAEDYSALKRKYSKSLARYLKANGADESIFKATDDASLDLLDRARTYAIEQAKQATFHEYSQMAENLSRFSNDLRKGSTGQKIAGTVLEGVLPFKKTPINILKQGVKYSPVSLFKALKKGMGYVSTGKYTASEVIDDLASGLTGSGIVALGAFLASKGWLTGGANENYDVDNAESEQGIQNYALKIGNSSYTLDWLAPFSLPLFVGAELFNSFVENGDDETDAVDKVINALTTIAEPVTEMSMLQGLNNVINEVSYSKENALATIAANTTLGYFTQGVPTLAGQIARSIDPYRRSTYSDEDGTFTRQVDKTVSKTLNKVPFLKPVVNAITGDSYGEKYIDYKGNPEMSQGLISTNLDKLMPGVGNNVLTRAMDQMLSPGYYREGNLTNLDNELNRLYEATGKQVYPEVYTGKVDGERLSKADHTKYQTLFGQTTNELFEKAILSPDYANLDDDQKADVITSLRTLAKDVADHDIGGKTLSSSKQKDYDLYKSEGADAVIEKKLAGKVLNDAGITNNEKNRALYQEQGQEFIEQKSAEQQLKDDYGVSGKNAMEAYDMGVSGEELQQLNTITLSNGKKGDYVDYATLHKAIPKVVATPEDYKRMYDTINSFDPDTKNVGQKDLLNFFNAVDPDYWEILRDIYFSSTSGKQLIRNMDGSYSIIK